MAARNATKAAQAAAQDNTKKAQARAVDEQQAANQTPPQDETRDGAPSEKTADYVHADGFMLNADGDVVDAEGLALPPVFEGEGGAALVLLSLVKACMPATEHSAALDTAAEKTRMLAESLDNIEIQAALEQAFNELTPAVRDVLIERERQVVAKGHTPERDTGYQNGELAMAAACYAVFAAGQQPHRSVFSWPFATAAFRPHDKRRAMVKAAALLLASIEALDLAEAAE
jgi:hypothetical protein